MRTILRRSTVNISAPYIQTRSKAVGDDHFFRTDGYPQSVDLFFSIYLLTREHGAVVDGCGVIDRHVPRQSATSGSQSRKYDVRWIYS